MATRLLRLTFVLVLVLVLLLGSLQSLVASERSVTTLPLSHSLPAQVLPSLRPHLSPGSTISAYRNTLIVNATAAELAMVKQLLAELDRSPRPLLIFVSTNAQQVQTSRELGVGYHGTIGNSEVSVGGSGEAGDTQNHVVIQNNSSTTSASGAQRVRAVEGSPAWINVGQSRFINVPQTTTSGNVLITQQPVSAGRGFYATAWVQNGRVQISLEQGNNRFIEANRIQGQQLQTQVSGALGQWIAVGGIEQHDRQTQAEIASRSRSSSSVNGTVYLKVVLLNH